MKTIFLMKEASILFISILPIEKTIYTFLHFIKFEEREEHENG